jgi:hypothetical protein
MMQWLQAAPLNASSYYQRCRLHGALDGSLECGGSFLNAEHMNVRGRGQLDGYCES